MTARLRPFVLLLFALLALAAAQDRRAVVVQLLALNDFHGSLEPPSGDNGRVHEIPAGGAEYLATHLKRAAATNPNSIVVAAGDLIGASPLLTALFHDEPTIESMNLMNLAVSSVGNHEFDHGRLELLRMRRGGCHPADGCQDGDGFAGARFQYLAANVVDTATSKTILPATAIRAVGGVRIGFIGETLRATRQVVLPEGIRGLDFLDEVATANQYAAALKQQGVRTIVLLIHEGARQQGDDNDADPNGCAGVSGALPSMLDQLSPDIQVIVSGHTHRFYNCTTGGRLLTSASSFGRMLTRINLTIDRSSGALTKAVATNQIVTRDVPKDPAQSRLIAKYLPLAAPIASRPIGSIRDSVLRQANDAGETPLGDLIADAQLASTSPPDRGGAQLALMNPGGIRADLVFSSPQGTETAPVTFGHLFTIQPFGNVLTVRTMTGDMLKRVLEQQFDNPGAGRQTILQVSNGFTYRYALGAPRGRRVDAASISIDGRAIRSDDRVRVTATNFLAAGGDDFSVFEEGTDPVGGELDLDATIGYVKANSPLKAPALDRIVRTD